MKMNSFQAVLLLLTAAAAGSKSVFNMSVSEKVHATRGDDALLSCSFTYPGQSSYSGPITVKWIAGEASGPLFFECAILNTSNADVGGCSFPELRHTLTGDPRQGELSLLIRNLTLMDENKYFCRVEIQGGGDTSGAIDLRVGWKPLIQSLEEINGTKNGSSLECVVEGRPPPRVTWFSKSKNQSQEPIDTQQSGEHQVTSLVSFDEDDQLTCQAENLLGRAERTYPKESSLVLRELSLGYVAGCVAGVLLLLVLVIGLVVCRRLSRGPPPDAAPVYENPDEAQNYPMKHLDSSPSTVYALVQPVSNIRTTSASAGITVATQQS